MLFSVDCILHFDFTQSQLLFDMFASGREGKHRGFATLSVQKWLFGAFTKGVFMHLVFHHAGMAYWDCQGSPRVQLCAQPAGPTAKEAAPTACAPTASQPRPQPASRAHSQPAAPTASRAAHSEKTAPQ